jgi:integrase
VNNITAVLSSLVKYAVKNKVIGPVDLSFTIKVQDSEIVAVAASDVDKLAAVADERYCAAILLAADAGLRIGEIRALRWSEVNELMREISISQSYDRTGELTETKGWERRVVPISDRLWSAMKKLHRVGPLVFSRLDGGALGYDATREAVREIYAHAEVELPPKPWHSLRHSFGTGLANAGVPVHLIKVLMGHKSIETTLRYMRTDRGARRDAIAALRGSHAAAKTGNAI